MTTEEKDLQNRYVYQVTRCLPKAQREEVRMELEELIGDMYADKGSMEAVLTQLGDPARFAEQYRSGRQYLIGPEYLESYLWFVRVVLLCVAVPVLVLPLVSALTDLPAAAGQDAALLILRAVAAGLRNGIVNALAGCVSAFGAVTLLFIVMEWQKVKIETRKAESWSVEKLADGQKPSRPRWTPRFLEPVPDQRAIINRGESAVGIVFMVVFCVLLIAAPWLFSAVFPQEGAVIFVPLFNLEQWPTILPVFVLSLVIALADEILQMVMGCYCKLVMISNILCGVIQILLCALLMKVLPFWNPNFLAEAQAALATSTSKAGEYLAYWNADTVSTVVLAVMILITLAEMGTTIYKTLRYGAAVRLG